MRAGDEPAAAVRLVGRARGPRRGVLAAGLGPVAPGWGAVGRLAPDLLALKVVEMDSTMEVYIEAACDACMGHLPSLSPPKLGLTACESGREP